MLERAARCLEVGARQKRQVSDSRHIPSRRLLHALFWNHAAPDLDPALLGFSSIKPTLDGIHAGDQPSITPTSTAQLPILDFLYPPKTIETIKRINARSARECNRQQKIARKESSLRRFVSTGKAAQQEVQLRHMAVDDPVYFYQKHTRDIPPVPTAPIDNPPRYSAWDLAEDTNPTHPPIDKSGAQEDLLGEAGLSISALKKTLRPRRSIAPSDHGELAQLISSEGTPNQASSWTKAWDLFQQLSVTQRSPELRKSMMAFLSQSNRSVDARRLVQVFEGLPTSHRDSQALLEVLLAQLQIANDHEAVQLLAEASSREIKPQEFDGTKILLYSLLSKRQFDLLDQAWDILIAHMSPKDLNNLSLSFIKPLCHMPNAIANLVAAVKQLESRPETLKEGYVQGLINTIIMTLTSSEDLANSRHAVELLEIVSKANGASRRMSDIVCSRLLKLSNPRLNRHVRVEAAHEWRELALQTYDVFRNNRGIGQTNINVVFAQSTMRPLLRAAALATDENRLLSLTSDYQHSYGALPGRTIPGIMGFYARRGDVQAVEKYFDLLKPDSAQTEQREALSENPLNIHAFYPLLHAHALRIDPEAIVNTMSKMRSDYSIEPDVNCYNMLMNAYRRMGDLENVMATASEISSKGLAMNEYSYFPMLSVCADRGDVHGVGQLIRAMERDGIEQNQAVSDFKVLAHLNNGDIERAEEIAREATLSSTKGSKTRMWNQVLFTVALHGDLAEVHRVCGLMKSLKVKFNDITYAALMRAFVVQGDALAAQRMLLDVLPKKNIKPLAIHYAIVMEGLATEYRFDEGLRLHALMLKNKIKRTTSTDVALLSLHTLAAKAKVKIDKSAHAGVRYDISEETLERILETLTPEAFATKEPQLYSEGDTLAGGLPLRVFELLLNVYDKQRSQDVVQMLLKKYEQTRDRLSSGARSAVPLKIIELTMLFHYRQRNNQEVDRYWKLAVAAAQRMSSRLNTKGQGPLPIARSTILSACIDIYIKALAAQERWKDLVDSLGEVLAAGFVLDSSNWNTYVKYLGMKGRYLEAFVACDRQLIPGFPTELPASITLSNPLLATLPANYQAAGAPAKVRYPTAVRLRHVISKLESDARDNPRSRILLKEIHIHAPRTVHWLKTVPFKTSPVATHVIGPNVSGNHKMPSMLVNASRNIRAQKDRKTLLRASAAETLQLAEESPKELVAPEGTLPEPRPNRNLSLRYARLERRQTTLDLKNRIFWRSTNSRRK